VEAPQQGGRFPFTLRETQRREGRRANDVFYALRHLRGC